MILEFSNRIRTFLLLSVLFFVPFALYAHTEPAPNGGANNPSAVNRKISDFVLVNQDNQRFDSAKLRGKVVVLSFIYTTCTDVCPIFTANIAQLQRALNDRYSSEIFFISITTDPEVDSPKVLKAYARRYNADFKNWAFLTGPESELNRVWKSFGIRVIRKARGLVQHISLTTIVDRQGVRRFNHYGEKWHVKDLKKDVLSLLEKKSN